MGKPTKHTSPSNTHLKKGEVAYIALKILIGGSFIAFSFMAPGFPAVLKMIDRNPRKALDKLDRALRRLVMGGHIEQVGSYGNRKFRITSKGAVAAALFELGTYRPPAKQAWDGRWRVICFDIPETHAHIRRKLHIKLRSLGFYKLQHSVFVYPYPCSELIELLHSHIQLKPHVRLITAEKIDNEKEVAAFFNLRVCA